MAGLITVEGAILSAMPLGESDRRIVLLTRQRGKLSAFAKGARRQGSPLMALAAPFVFGTFTLYEGRNSYTLQQVQAGRQFISLASCQPGIYYGYYFAEIADYFGHEGTDEKEMLNLLYVSFHALEKGTADPALIRSAFELRAMTEQGLMPQVSACVSCGTRFDGDAGWFFSQNAHGLLCPGCAASLRRQARPAPGNPSFDGTRIRPATVAAMRYVTAAPLKKLFSFSLLPDAEREFAKLSAVYLQRGVDRKLKSLRVLEAMER